MNQHDVNRRGFLQVAGVAVAGLANATKTGATPRFDVPAGSVFDVREYGAKGDGKSLDTPAINQAIEAAALAGGGTVVFPARTHLSYSIHLRSRVALTLGMGATILAADSPVEGQTGYDLAESNKPWEAYQDFGHNHWHNSLIWGEDLDEVTIQGTGLI